MDTPPYIAPIESHAGRSFTAAELAIRPLVRLAIAGREVVVAAPPDGYRLHADLGIIAHAEVGCRRLHGWPAPDDFAEPVRVLRCADGTWIATCPVGRRHQFGSAEKGNELVQWRSADRGATWQGPVRPWRLDVPQHCATPMLLADGGILAFSTDYRSGRLSLPHAGGLSYRRSDDHGRGWGPLVELRPRNAPDFRGVLHMRGCRTRLGTLLVPTYDIPPLVDGVRGDHQYVLRSEDEGRTWDLLPGRNRGLTWDGHPRGRLLEGCILEAGDECLMFLRSQSGWLFLSRSADDGRSWSRPAAIPVRHADAPPMVFAIDEAGTLAAFTHRGGSGRQDAMEERSELWVQLSRDRAQTWSEPRLLAVNIAIDALPGRDGHRHELSYADLIVDGGRLHLFLDRSKRQLLNLEFARELLERLPAWPAGAR